MAYVAVICLKHTAEDLLTNSSRLSLSPSTQQILPLICKYTGLLQELLRKDNNTKRLEGFVEPIIPAAHRFQDALELTELESYGAKPPLVDLETVIKQEFDLFSTSANNFIAELSMPIVPEEEEDGDIQTSASPDLDVGVEMVGHNTEFAKLRDYMLNRVRPDDMCFFSLVAESGTGRSIMANTVFEDEDQRFDCKAWVTIGTHFQQWEIVRLILYQLDNDFSEEEEEDGDDEDERIRNYLYKALEGRRYLIVLDDVCSVEVFDYLKSSFPDQSNGSLVLLTTNKREMIGSLQPYLGTNVVTRVGDFKDWGWWYLRQAVFGDIFRLIHPQVVEAIKKIGENCGGRRLALAKTLLFLVKKQMTTVEQWSYIAAHEEHPIFKVEDEVSEVQIKKLFTRTHLND